MLRAQFADDGRQRILPERRQPALIVRDLRDSMDAGPLLEKLRDESSHARLDVAAGEVFSIQLSLLPDGRTRLHVDVDMLAADALSYRVLLSDLARCYANPEGDSGPITYSYPRYLAEHELARKPDRERDRKWWQQRIPE